MQISGSKTGIQLLKDLESKGECELQLVNDGSTKDCHRKSSNQIHCDLAFQRIKILKAKNKPTVYRALFKFTQVNTRKLKLG
jgi:hypothetical protein